jgi:hypothetical protein
MKTIIIKSLFTIALFGSLIIISITNANEREFRTHAIENQANNCMTSKQIPDSINNQLQSKTDIALNRIDSEGITECNNLADKIEQAKCLKVLDVARAMINLAHEKQVTKIACR